MITYFIVGIVIALAIWGTVRRIRYGSSCCGEREPAPKKVRAADTNKANYKYVYSLKVDGMHCSNCARRVENSFNSREGMWAKADVGQKKVELRSKKELDFGECRVILDQAGYTLLDMQKNN